MHMAAVSPKPAEGVDTDPTHAPPFIWPTRTRPNGNLHPQKTTDQSGDEMTCSMVSMFNMLQIKPDIDPGHWNLILRYAVDLGREMGLSTQEDEDYLKKYPIPRFVRWQSVHDPTNVHATVGDPWNTVAAALLFRILGLKARVLDEDEIEANQQTGTDELYEYGILSVEDMVRSESHAMALVAGVLIDPWRGADSYEWRGFKKAEDTRAAIYSKLKCVPLALGTFKVRSAVIVYGPMMLGPPYSRLDYDRRSLLRILEDRDLKASVGAIEGDIGAPPIDLTGDDDDDAPSEPEKKRRKI